MTDTRWWHPLPRTATADARRILLARALRATTDGTVSLLLPLYLLELGFDAARIGLLISATLLGSAACTLGIGAVAHRLQARPLLIFACLIMAATGLGFAALTDYWPLVVVAFLGTMNPTGGDVSLFMPLEQALLAETVSASDRTALFARYSLVGTAAGAVGALGAGLPDLAQAWAGWSPPATMRLLFLVYGASGLAALLIYRRLSPRPTVGGEARQALGASRGVIWRLSLLFGLDSFGSGFFVQSVLALYLYRTFDLTPATTGLIFFWANLGSAASFLLAVPVARRFGLINCMVFTHFPAGVMIVLIPFIDDLRIVIVLLLARFALSQMDVPARTSYVMAVVTPAERAAAAGITNVPRSLGSAVGPAIAGWLFTLTPFGWPLVIGGILKCSYDLLLLRDFRHVKPPEEIDRQS